jgi:hypothetical protein
MEPIRIAVMFIVLIGAFIQRERMKHHATPPRYWQTKPIERDTARVDSVDTYTTNSER